MGGEAPLISVLMGVRYRREDLSMLKRSVHSILAQTYTNFEFLICDSGSSVEACLVLNEFAQTDHRIILVRDETMPMDLAHKLNACLNCAEGEIIARMDDDDFSHPNRFEMQLKFLYEHSEVSFVGCNVALQKNGNLAGCRVLPEYPMVKDFYFTQPFIHPALMFRREALTSVGGYSESKHQVLCEDYDLLLRLYERGMTGANIQRPLLTYTLPPCGTSNRSMRQRWNEARTRFVRFRSLGVLPQALPYVVKPLAVGLIPITILEKWKERRQRSEATK